ncbi:MAG: DNA-binding transcriptional LysR family regulator [Myxococcota bacterium]|jgi:DNA-binding transcriptional LysR family regulator
MGAQMRWDDVQVFVEVARQGSLSGAGRVLKVDHSTVYRRLNQLEEHLGVPLFHRDGGRYRLTDAGIAACADAEAASNALASFRRTVMGYDDRSEGIVKLTAPESLLGLLAPLAASFRAAHPSIELQMAFTDRFLDLSRQEADVAVRPTLSPPENLVGRKVAAIAWTTYAPVSGAEPTELPWAVYGDELVTLAAARWCAAQHHAEPVLLTVNSVPSMARVICEAGCRGLLPCFVGDADPQLLRLRPPIEGAASALWLLVHPDMQRTFRVRALLDHLWTGLQTHTALLVGKPV